jgi:hypothetical protein
MPQLTSAAGSRSRAGSVAALSPTAQKMAHSYSKLPIGTYENSKLPRLSHWMPHATLLLLVLTLPTLVQAQFRYEDRWGTITITGYDCPVGAATIPSTIDDLPVTSIGDSAFYRCASLASVTIPDSVDGIGVWAFLGCSNLTSVTIPSSVTDIGLAAFLDCTSLTSVTIPSGVTGIGYGTFLGCTSLASVTIPSSVTDIGERAFQGCASLASVIIPPGVNSIGVAAFAGCSSLTSVTIPGGVNSIGEAAFASCTSLASVTIPSGVTSIGERAFYGCASLASVTIASGVTDIGGEAFSGCSSLTSVTIPSSVTSAGYGTFWGCTSLTAINVDADNSTYASVDGVLFDKSLTTLIQSPGGKAGSYTIPRSVTSIRVAAFFSCSRLASVTIPGSITNIGESAFYGCPRLASVYFQGNAPTLGQRVFDTADNVTVYYLPKTTGWRSTFGGRPTALWKPQVQASDTSFGVQTNQFGFHITWANNTVVVVEACTDLAQPIWSPMGTNTLTDSTSDFSDPQWTNHPTRFYRLRSP